MDKPLYEIYRNLYPSYVEKKQPLVSSSSVFRSAVILLASIIGVAILILLSGCDEKPVWAEETTLKASWYSIDSLKKEGTYKYSKGIMANGKEFKDNGYTCASRLYRLNTLLRITNPKNGKSIYVKVTDRISKRFAKSRIDLSKGAFSKIADCKQGVVSVFVEVI